MSMMKRRSLLPGVLLLCLPVLAPSPGLGADPMIGESAPAFELPTLAGEQVALSDFRGQLVVLHFGAGW